MTNHPGQSHPNDLLSQTYILDAGQTHLAEPRSGRLWMWISVKEQLQLGEQVKMI